MRFRSIVFKLGSISATWWAKLSMRYSGAASDDGQVVGSDWNVAIAGVFSVLTFSNLEARNRV